MIGRKKSSSSRLRHLLTLQKEVQTADNVGGYVRSWQDVANLWAEIIAWSGKELPYGGQMESHVTHRLVLRYVDGVSAGQRLVFEDRVFSIRYVRDVEENKKQLQLLVEEGGAG